MYDTMDNIYIRAPRKTSCIKVNDHDNNLTFSSQSVFTAMNTFIITVNNMNDTVMLPCRLQDIDLQSKGEAVPLMMRGASDPYAFYSLINTVKADILWGPRTTDDEDPKPTTPSARPSVTSITPTANVKGHARRQSSVSMASVHSNTSEGDSVGDGEQLSDAGDSGVESEVDGGMDEVTKALRSHVKGMNTCLQRLSETAQYITDLYQKEISI